MDGDGLIVVVVVVATDAILVIDLGCLRKVRASEFVNDNMVENYLFSCLFVFKFYLNCKYKIRDRSRVDDDDED